MRHSDRWFAVLTVVICFSAIGPLEVLADGHPKVDFEKGWVSLFNGKDLTHWETRLQDGREAPTDAWAVEDGTLMRKGRSYLRTRKQFRDFVLDLEFKLGPRANSGILLRHRSDYSAGTPQYWWNGLLEVQILDSYGSTKPNKHDCGALYDMVAPSKNTVKPPGKWNRVTVTAKGSRIGVVLNGQEIIDANLADWTEAGKNPDGTPNKYHKPMCKLTGEGFIWLQDHPGDIWFRNISIKPLD